MGLKTRFLIRKNQGRIKRWMIIWSLLVVLVMGGLSYSWIANAYFQQEQQLLPQDVDWIAQKIYQNEVGGNPDNLTFWHPKEEFPSLGIGHFIWLPTGTKVPFVETFPDMVAYVAKAERPPKWMVGLDPFKPPWTTRQQFYDEFHSPEMQALRHWLRISMRPQAEFIYLSLKKKLPEAISALSSQQRHWVDLKVRQLEATREGRFVLIDYYNFKGLGDNPKERYEGKGWGLIQVLEGMERSSHNADVYDPIPAFVASAKRVLRQRVALSPTDREERGFLKGWDNRVNTYLHL